MIFAKWKPRPAPEAPPPQPPVWAAGAAACTLLTSLTLSYLMVKSRPAAPLSSSACRRVLKYRIGSVDPRFKVSREDLRSALRPAAAVWEQAAGRTLFQPDEDAADLTLKLAHELGHSLGLQHVANPKSIMYYLLKEQDRRTLALSSEDRAALAAECSK